MNEDLPNNLMDNSQTIVIAILAAIGKRCTSVVYSVYVTLHVYTHTTLTYSGCAIGCHVYRHHMLCVILQRYSKNKL